MHKKEGSSYPALHPLLLRQLLQQGVWESPGLTGVCMQQKPRGRKETCGSTPNAAVTHCLGHIKRSPQGCPPHPPSPPLPSLSVVVHSPSPPRTGPTLPAALALPPPGLPLLTEKPLRKYSAVRRTATLSPVGTYTPMVVSASRQRSGSRLYTPAGRGGTGGTRAVRVRGREGVARVLVVEVHGEPCSQAAGQMAGPATRPCCCKGSDVSCTMGPGTACPPAVNPLLGDGLTAGHPGGGGRGSP